MNILAAGSQENVREKSRTSSDLGAETHGLSVKAGEGFDRPVDLTRILSSQAGLALADALAFVNQLTDY